MAFPEAAYADDGGDDERRAGPPDAYYEPLDFQVQVPGAWLRIVDSSAGCVVDVSDAAHLPDGPVTVGARSIVVLST